MTRQPRVPTPDGRPFDRRGVLTSWLDRLEPAPSLQIRSLALGTTRGCHTNHSVTSYAQELSAYLRWCAQTGLDPLAATDDDAVAYADSITRYALGTQNLKLQIARRLFKEAMRSGVVDENPFSEMRLPSRKPRRGTPAITKAQAEALLSATRAGFDDPVRGLCAKRDYTLMTLMLRLALRTEEVCDSLTWGCFGDHDGHVRLAFLGKGREPAELDLPPDVWQTLQSWQHAYERATGVTLTRSDPVALPVDSRALKRARALRDGAPLAPLGRRALHGMVVNRLADIGLAQHRLAPHALRATCAVLAYHAGAEIIEIQQMLRHKQIETTMRYLQALLGGAARAAIDRIELDVPRWDDANDDPWQPAAELPAAEPGAAAFEGPARQSVRQPGRLVGPHPADIARARRRAPAGSDVRDAERWAPPTLSPAARAYLAALRADGHQANVGHLRATLGIDESGAADAEYELLGEGLIAFTPSGMRVQRTAAGMAADLPPAAHGQPLSAVATALLVRLPVHGATVSSKRLAAECGLPPEVFAHAVRELRGAGLVRIGRGVGIARVVAQAHRPTPSSASPAHEDGDREAA